MFKITLQATIIFALLSGYTYASAPLPHKEAFVEVEGGKLFYLTMGKNNESPIIVLHGGPGVLDHSYLLPQMLELAVNNQVTFYDQRGSGKSLGFALNESTINVDNFVKDLEYLRKKLGYKKFTLLGHSWGGVLAMKYAIAYPENLSGLILVGSAPHNTAGFNQFVEEYQRRTAPLADKLAKIMATDQFKHNEPEAISEYMRTIFYVYFYQHDYVNQLSLPFTKESYVSGSKVAEILQKNFLAKFDLTAQLRELKVPVLIIHGKKDIVPIKTAKAIRSVIHGSQIVTLSNCDHFPYIEQPKKFFAAITNFLGQSEIDG